jgi:Tfp pilus assembly protein PilO
MIDPPRVDRVGRIAAATLVVGFSALVTFQAIRPLVGARRDLGAFREAIVILSDAEVSVDRLDSEIQLATEDLRRSQSLLPAELNLDSFLEQVGEIAKDTGTRIETLTPVGSAEHHLFREMMLEVRVRGSFPEIREFLDQLEHGTQLSRVEQLQVAKSKGDEDCSASLRVALYFAPGSKG